MGEGTIFPVKLSIYIDNEPIARKENPKVKQQDMPSPAPQKIKPSHPSIHPSSKFVTHGRPDPLAILAPSASPSHFPCYPRPDPIHAMKKEKKEQPDKTNSITSPHPRMAMKLDGSLKKPATACSLLLSLFLQHVPATRSANFIAVQI